MKQSITNYLTLTCIVLVFGSNLLAQNRTKILTPFYLNEVGLAYDSLPKPPGYDPNDPYFGYNGMKAKGSQNIQVDKNGKIIFFIVDGFIFDRKGNKLGNVSNKAPNHMLSIPYGNGANEWADGGFGETAIIPSPDCETSNSYFIVTTYRLFGNPGSVDGYSASWDKVVISYDANDNVTAGSYVLSNEIYNGPNQANIEQLLFRNLIPGFGEGGIGGHCNSPLIAVSKVLSGNKRFIYVLNQSSIYKLKIQNNQLVYENALDLYSYFNSVDKCNPWNKSELELVSLPNGDLRLAFPVNGKVTQQDIIKLGFATLDFSSSTGSVLPGSLKTVFYNTADDLAIKGAELSPDGSKIYLSHNSHSLYPSTLDMFDLTATNPIASRLVLSTNSDFADSQIESGMNGILLIPSSNQLYKITNPNTLTPTLSNYQSLVTYPATCRFPTCDPNERVRLMQDQIDGEDYSALGGVVYSTNNYNVTVSETWSDFSPPFNVTNGIVYIKESIVVKAGKTLTINNLTLKFAPNARIIVENGYLFGPNTNLGGKLILNNTILTSADECSSTMWRGVEVRGIATYSQGTAANSYQGRVFMNNSIISNAIKGVVALRYNKVVNGNNVIFTADNSGAGGIIQATNSSFINNQNDISLLNYNSQSVNNLSFFKNCVFQTSSLLNDPSLDLENHITLTSVKGISILGCDFINSTTGLFSIEKRGIGIYAVGSSFTVEPRCMNLTYPCNQLDRGKFEDLTYGIAVTSLLSTLTFKCDRTDFKNNAIGIVTVFSTSPQITRNTFEVKEISTSNPIINQSAGIYMEYSTNYQVEENTFKEFNDAAIPNGSANSYGIVVSNSGIENNLIYKNTFSNLKIGGQSEGTNGRTKDPNNQTPVDIHGMMSGLQWKCNTFNSPIYSNDLTVIDGVIDYNQGFTSTASIDFARKNAANNKFSLLGEASSLNHDFFLNTASQEINYVFTTGNNYVPDSYTSNMVAQPSMFNNLPVAYSDMGCPSKIIDGGIIISPPFKFNRLGGEKNPYGGRVLSEKNNELIRYLLTDTTLEEGYSILNELLSENKDEEYKILKCENQLFNLHHTLSEVIANNPDLSQDEVALLTIKNTIHQEGIEALKDDTNSAELLASLNSIINSTTDLMLKKQAEIIYSFSQPQDLSYHFLEDMSPKSYQDANDGNQAKSQKNAISIYPNPASSELTFKIDFELNENVEVTVYSTLGTQIATWSLNKDKFTVDVSKLTNGIYIIHMNDAQGTNIQNIKFIKK
ncbi:MAG: T9SS type A sorting domain-containing protein [Crocinitomicaceae bacterium]|nr:T9SS type A sorting domain-containing protein [Crocinitomicaceae bacterium]